VYGPDSVRNPVKWVLGSYSSLVERWNRTKQTEKR